MEKVSEYDGKREQQYTKTIAQTKFQIHPSIAACSSKLMILIIKLMHIPGTWEGQKCQIQTKSLTVCN